MKIVGSGAVAKSLAAVGVEKSEDTNDSGVEIVPAITEVVVMAVNADAVAI